MNARTTQKARRFLAELNGNVDAWYAGQISSETFTLLQKETWDAVCAAGAAVRAEVLGLVRAQLPLVQRER
jgi:hypothetical protein